MTAGDDVRRRERAFYDREAAERAPAEPPRPPDDYDRSLIAALQPLEGRRVLELGCGRGDLTLQLLDAGAEVTAVDVSPAMWTWRGRGPVAPASWSPSRTPASSRTTSIA